MVIKVGRLSLRPTLEIFGLVVPSWHLFYVIGSIFAFYLMLAINRLNNDYISRAFLARLFVVVYVSGYFGARGLSLFAVQDVEGGVLGHIKQLFLLGPMTLLGGVVCSVIFGSLYAYFSKLKQKGSLRYLFDIAVPAFLIGLSFGRIGCYLNGDDYGLPILGIDLENIPWWAVSFPNLNDLAEQIYRYPTQLIEAFFTASLASVLVAVWQRVAYRFGVGFIGAGGLFLYSIFRFFIEMYRGDHRGWVVYNLISTSQFISILIFLIAGGFLIRFYLQYKDHKENLQKLTTN